MQGGGLKRGNTYATLEEVRDDLASFHSIDVENTDKMSLNDLCEVGSWQVVDMDGNTINV